MDRNTALAFVLIGLVLMVWLWTNSPDPNQQPKKKQDTTAQIDTSKIKKEEERAVQAQTPTPIDTLGQYFSTAQAGKNQIVTIENDLFRAELTSTGAKIQKFFLKKYNEWYGGDVQLINSKAGGDFSVTFLTLDGKLINTSGFEFKPEKNLSYLNTDNSDSVSVSFVMKVSETSSVRKTYTAYKGKYSLKADIEFISMERIISNRTFTVNWQNGIRFVEKNTHDEATFSKALFYAAEEEFDLDASSPNEKYIKDANGAIDWAAIKNKYFAVAIIPEEIDQDGGITLDGKKYIGPNRSEYENYSIIFKQTFNDRSYQKKSYELYLGPIEYDILNNHHHSLVALVDFGTFFGLTFIVRPIAEYVLLPLFKFLHSFISNFGLVIIIFSLIIKIVLHPLTKQSMKSMKKMSLLQPKMTELREKLKDNPQKMNQEVMKLYKTYGINPAGGCLPILLQMPILIALYGLFRSTIELRHEPFVWWIKDLSIADVIATLPFRIPIFEINEISGLALLLGVTMFLQQKMTITDPRQKAMVYIMPVMFTLLFNSFPSGLNLYYFMFNLFSIAQQQYMNKFTPAIELQPVKDTGKKSWMQRLMQQAEENAKDRRKRMAKGKF
ncbi:MAG: membrane protein insertase YidC [Ignavibacteria bacterium]|nr:membrane protein insertase YidC [Ignavibacteria bacterium]